MPDREAGGFIDQARISVKGGKGGNGVASFRREKYVPRGGPDGGDGGRGGDVVLRGARNLNTLYRFQHQAHFAAGDGGNGAGAKKHGKRGADLVIEVPLGTSVEDQEGPIADITHDGQTVTVARGGKGGLGNVHFATPTVRAPRMARKGDLGEDRRLNLELKTLGDVGLIGEPNAGKSSLLAALSAARPEIGAYPFTTLAPNLGVAEVGDLSFVVVDIPGLIEGAHAGRGLGHQFLRHVQRARILVHVLDAAGPDPLGSYETVRGEMEIYDRRLLDRSELIAANKIDLPEGRSRWDEIERRFRPRAGGRVLAVSALTGEGVPGLLAAIKEGMEALPALERIDPPAVRTYRLAPAPGHQVLREGEAFRVRGPEAERVVARADLDSDEGIADLQRQLSRIGVLRYLEREGVKPGDTVRIGDFELEWT